MLSKIGLDDCPHRPRIGSFVAQVLALEQHRLERKARELRIGETRAMSAEEAAWKRADAADAADADAGGSEGERLQARQEALEATRVREIVQRAAKKAADAAAAAVEERAAEYASAAL